MATERQMAFLASMIEEIRQLGFPPEQVPDLPSNLARCRQAVASAAIDYLKLELAYRKRVVAGVSVSHDLDQYTFQEEGEERQIRNADVIRYRTGVRFDCPSPRVQALWRYACSYALNRSYNGNKLDGAMLDTDNVDRIVAFVESWGFEVVKL